MASAAMVVSEVEDETVVQPEFGGVEEKEVTAVAFQLWHLGSCAGLETEEDLEEAPETVACHSSCL